MGKLEIKDLKERFSEENDILNEQSFHFSSLLTYLIWMLLHRKLLLQKSQIELIEYMEGERERLGFQRIRLSRISDAHTQKKPHTLISMSYESKKIV